MSEKFAPLSVRQAGQPYVLLWEHTPITWSLMRQVIYWGPRIFWMFVGMVGTLAVLVFAAAT